MKPLDELVRPNILTMKPYSSARDEFEGEGEVFLDANENPYETGLNRYPDPYQRALKEKIAEIKGIDSQNIFLGNGSDEAIDLIIRIFCEPEKDGIIITDPTYGMYQVSAAIQNITVVRVALSNDFTIAANDVLAAVRDNTKVIFLCSPNNPSGNDLDHEEVLKILKDFHGIVVIDEAYIDFTDQPGFLGELPEFPNLIILQTFSKAWGLAGLRLGMAFTSLEIISLFNKVKPPYNLNILTQNEALHRISNKAEMEKNTREILSEREWLAKELLGLGITVKIHSSSTNFLLVRFDHSDRIFHYLMDQDIIVRDRSRTLHCDGCLRITVGTKDENRKLIEALKSFQQNIKEGKTTIALKK